VRQIAITSALKHKPTTNTEPELKAFTFPAADFPVADEAEAEAEVVPAAEDRAEVAAALDDAPPLELLAEPVAEEELAVIPVTRSGTAGPVV